MCCFFIASIHQSVASDELFSREDPIIVFVKSLEYLIEFGSLILRGELGCHIGQHCLLQSSIWLYYHKKN